MSENEDKKPTEPLDPKYENGPIEDRGCTDIICCILFLLSLVALIAIAAYGIKNGNPAYLVSPFDTSGQACGYNESVKDYPYIYFLLPAPGYFNSTVCVSECPTSASHIIKCNPTLDYSIVFNNAKLQLKDKTLQTIVCNQTMNLNGSFSDLSFWSTLTNTVTSLKDSKLPIPIDTYDTFPFLKRICMPNISFLESLNLSVSFGNSSSTQLLQTWIGDVSNSWKVFLIALGCAFIVGFIYLIFMRFCAGVLTWFAIIAFFAGIYYLGYIVNDQAKYISTTTQYELDIKNNQTSSDTVKTYKTYLYGSYAIWGVDGLCILLVLCIYNRIALAIAIVKTAAHFIASCPLSLMVPPIIAILFFATWALFIAGFVFIVSVGDIKQNSQGYCWASVEWNTNVRYALCYFIFGALWKTCFIDALGEFIIAGACSIWYWSIGSEAGAHNPIRRALSWAFFKHLGSLAFGSLILAIVKFIRLVFEYINRQMKQAGGDDNQVMKYIINCTRCFLACLERFISFLNRNAYIQIAITGQNFCSSAKDAVKLLLCNPVRTAILNGLGGILLWVGELLIIASTTVICYACLTKVPAISDGISSAVFPLIICLVISGAIGSLFMSVYGMACDTILLSFLMDEEYAKAKGTQPSHTPPNLQDFIDKVPIPAAKGDSAKVSPQQE